MFYSAKNLRDQKHTRGTSGGSRDGKSTPCGQIFRQGRSPMVVSEISQFWKAVRSREHLTYPTHYLRRFGSFRPRLPFYPLCYSEYRSMLTAYEPLVGLPRSNCSKHCMFTRASRQRNFAVLASSASGRFLSPATRRTQGKNHFSPCAKIPSYSPDGPQSISSVSVNLINDPQIGQSIWLYLTPLLRSTFLHDPLVHKYT